MASSIEVIAVQQNLQEQRYDPQRLRSCCCWDEHPAQEQTMPGQGSFLSRD